MDRALVAVIGPSNITRVGAAAGIEEEHYRRTSYDVGAAIARRGDGLVVVPDRGVAVAAMDGYLDNDGVELIGLCPSSGVSEQAGAAAIAAERRRCHRVLEDLSWYEQHYRIGALSAAMVCIGLSSGTIAELVWTKWNPAPPPVALVEGTYSAVPVELLAELALETVPVAAVETWLDERLPSATAAA